MQVNEADNRIAFGRRLRALRKQRDLTLVELGSRVGLTASSLSKVEKGNVSISFDALSRLAAALEVNLPTLFDSTELPSPASGRLSVNSRDDGRVYETGAYVYRLLCTSIVNKRMVPIYATIKAHSAEGFGPLIRHSGEEFLFVLQGEVSVLTELYEPVHLRAGESIYLDSTMAHGVISAGTEDAEVLWIALGDNHSQIIDGSERVSVLAKTS